MEVGQPKKCALKNERRATLRVGVYRINSHPDQFRQRKNRSQADINSVKLFLNKNNQAVSTNAGGSLFRN